MDMDQNLSTEKKSTKASNSGALTLAVVAAHNLVVGNTYHRFEYYSTSPYPHCAVNGTENK